MVIVGLVMSALDRYTPIPMSIDDGLKVNYYLLPMLVIGLFYVVYILLYKFGKVNGRLLLYTYWIEKRKDGVN